MKIVVIVAAAWLVVSIVSIPVSMLVVRRMRRANPEVSESGR